MNLGWNCSQVFKLIDLYRTQESLWNTKSPFYKDKLKNYGAWKYISAKLGTDKSEVKKKMAKLIGQYNREVRQLRETGIERKWFAFSRMNFLRERVVDRSFTTDTNEATSILQEDLEGDCEENDTNSVHYSENTSEYEYKEKPSNKQTQKTTFRYQTSAIDKNIINNHDEDEFDFFGKAIAIQLRKMPLEAALNLQQELQSVVSRHRINLIKCKENAQIMKITDESPGPSMSVSSGYNNEDFLEERDRETIDMWDEEKPIILHEGIIETNDEPCFPNKAIKVIK